MQQLNCEAGERTFLQLLAQRRREQPAQLIAFQEVFLRCERKVALLERFQPTNWLSQVEELGEALREGRYRAPRFQYQPLGIDYAQLIIELEALRLGLARLPTYQDWQLPIQLLEERAVELVQEADLVRARGSKELVAAVNRRFSFDAELVRQSDVLAEKWLVFALKAPENQQSPEVLLASYLSERCRRENLTFSIIERPLASVAAASAEGLLVQRGARVTLLEAARIWMHEVHAHVLPRQTGVHSIVPLVVGTAGATDDEEGRALLLEQRSGLLHQNRKLELAVRHLVCRAARSKTGAVQECAEDLLARGVEPSLLAKTICRALRGGGLARETVYLPAMLRAEQVLKWRPELEKWLKFGRVSLDASAELALWLEPSSLVHRQP